MKELLEHPRLDWKVLEEHRFDRDRFLEAARLIRDKQLTAESSLIREAIDPVHEVEDLDTEGDATLGQEALARGEVAVVVLNGGMATRFGNVVKGVVEVYEGKSFIALKAEDVLHARARYGADIPLVLMNSFATSEKTSEHAEAKGRFDLGESLLSFSQSISLRLSPDAELFEEDGEPSYYAPGHGDFFPSIRASGVLEGLKAKGVKTILFSNVDNLGATIDPAVLTAHLRSGADMTVEVTAKKKTASGAWDKGGAPAKVAGRKQLVEGFRLPKDLPPTHLPDFSTNNFLFRVEAIDQPIQLHQHVVEKQVGGRTALQLESIACEASAIFDEDGNALLSLHVLRVPREGARGRFFPVKERVDLDALRGALKERLEAGWRAMK
ncbi:MAG: UTP--glucose-1-phosphate uridylyltransferase [Deltaproteobacteria bacterium]|nr:UTP--glucose-1-phosphate uridylyltransferase [Deltaproteobacteria bacterium]